MAATTIRAVKATRNIEVRKVLEATEITLR